MGQATSNERVAVMGAFEDRRCLSTGRHGSGQASTARHGAVAELQFLLHQRRVIGKNAEAGDDRQIVAVVDPAASIGQILGGGEQAPPAVAELKAVASFILDAS
ncbi:MAG: hypothetical protein AUK47_17310 [Deltaproteobacteria bacterium CG2_30_63_29]|nr:MAG: hypothetical protein AUK47_17310 [Deltaproteobacteria bacterium CG2_30_63_29]PIV98819.1 MAG: hypothetical protein COW42_13095 [Deltaproteobacteria bacterium CG17_big_fil_post_rev_8_21_14_2_50_63_7]